MSKPSTFKSGMWGLVVVVVSCVAPLDRALALDPPVNATLVGQWNEYVGAYSDIWGDGNFAYISNWPLSDGNAAQVHVLDISDPANPVLDETLFLPPPNNFASPQDIKVGDGLLFIGLEADPNDGVAIYDVRDPANRHLVGTVTVPGFQTVHNLFYEGGFLYIPSGTSIAIVDLTAFDPDNPPAGPITTAKWVISGVGTNFVHDVTVANGRLYAAAWSSGLWVYDVSDVANTMPPLLGSVGGQSTHSMWPTADGKFVVTGEERTGGGIQVFEMTDNGGSLSFTLRDSLTFPQAEAFSVHNQVMVGNRLYNSWYAKGMQVFDIDPTTGALQFVASYDTSDAGLGNWGIYPILGETRILLSDVTNGCFVVALDSASVPAVSTWGLIAMTLLLLSVGSVLVLSHRTLPQHATLRTTE